MSKELTPLKALEQLKYYNTFANDDFDMTKELDIIESALKKLEQAENCVFTSKEDVKKEHQALEIIKEKKVDVDLFYTIMEDVNQTNKLWSYNFWQKEESKLTQEEYELLREVLL